jgi:predicted ATPase
MQGKRLLKSIRLKNLLSYGSEGETLELEPLNVLIGSNASGKSNLIDAISVLAAAPRDLFKPFWEGGGTSEWLWKGSEKLPRAELEAIVEYRQGPLQYRLALTAVDFRLKLMDERIAYAGGSSAVGERLLYKRGTNAASISMHGSDKMVKLRTGELDLEQSVLSQRKDPRVYPELTYLGEQLAKAVFFRDWSLSRSSMMHRAQDSDLPNDFLLEDARNLALVLNDLQNRPETKRLLLEKLKVVYEGIEDITTRVQSGSIQILLHERGLKLPVPASRVSYGVLHYLCLLTILLHPEPPPLICLEEPELGLHPDIIHKIADLLIDASLRTQLIVTTHSETLISRLSEVPESVVVCERDDRGTRLQRLEPERMKAWLERYSLGELWSMGEIGGNRW